MIDLNELQQGGQLYWAFPLSKPSLLVVKLGLELAHSLLCHWSQRAPLKSENKNILFQCGKCSFECLRKANTINTGTMEICGLYYKSFMIVIYNSNNSMIIPL